MSDNQYDNFKQGIKNDINSGVSALVLIGGLFLLVIVMLTGLYVAIRAYKMDTSVRLFIGIGVLILGGFMLFNKKALNLILSIWVILLIAAIVLPVLFIAGYGIYQMFKQPYYQN